MNERIPRRFKRPGTFFSSHDGTLWFGDHEAYERFEADPRDDEPAADLPAVLAMIEVGSAEGDLTPAEVRWLMQLLNKAIGR